MNLVQTAYQKLLDQCSKSFDRKKQAKSIVIQVGSATCENAAGATEILDEFKKHIEASARSDIQLKVVGCTGRCSREPIVTVLFPGKTPVTYQKVNRENAHEIFIQHVLNQQPVTQALLPACEGVQKSESQQQLMKEESTKTFFAIYGNLPFYCDQCRLSLRNIGHIEPLNLSEYICKVQGFKSLAIVLEKQDPEWVVAEISNSNLRGRGGAGFPTGRKWQLARANAEKTRYIVCNADEGDPGAFMDRSLLESDPWSVIEGMIIGGFAIGASQGFVYIRAEYPLAVERVEQAIQMCREKGLLGKNILGSGFDFDIEIRLGAGAFVCGEETALIQSIEGERGQPRVRPPYPAVRGLWNKPTIINNVETFANVSVIFLIGSNAFKKIGTEKSGGTKAFALAGKVVHTGLVEVPIGTSLSDIVYKIGGGVPNGKQLKAVQTGGPAGGTIPAHLMDTPVDYDTLVKIGSMMGSGGMIVIDETDCVVDMAKFFLTFTQDESCGKCTPCREGTRRMLEILERITQGKGTLADLDKLERLGKLLQKASLCGLGKGAPNPVLSTLKHFRSEYEAHVVEKRCPAGKCVNLIHFEINSQKCVGCTACAKVCPVQCISGVRKEVHVIDQNRCIKCGNCFAACRFGAVDKL